MTNSLLQFLYIIIFVSISFASEEWIRKAEEDLAKYDVAKSKLYNCMYREDRLSKSAFKFFRILGKYYAEFDLFLLECRLLLLRNISKEEVDKAILNFMCERVSKDFKVLGIEECEFKAEKCLPVFHEHVFKDITPSITKKILSNSPLSKLYKNINKSKKSYREVMEIDSNELDSEKVTKVDKFYKSLSKLTESNVSDIDNETNNN
ncbi:uncharacterized protein LOC126905657 [Daktulosphaira vitifoliae]|uniref:uncharacterized protein LOC126905657 n=1 Tax=Daktulosphaira vitifoliae TaxID=58002 RepID=UPI0021AAB6FF|nr:uncharacterized protein LOC126905657 [Daktulosphaira vitifoliae]